MTIAPCHGCGCDKTVTHTEPHTTHWYCPTCGHTREDTP
jgi:predicted RNA-binding Zn-ribbon protein involved in translation (DUF1610 family)